MKSFAFLITSRMVDGLLHETNYKFSSYLPNIKNRVHFSGYRMHGNIWNNIFAAYLFIIFSLRL